jgi:hypothetical protein
VFERILALVRITEDIGSARAEGKVMVHVLLDFYKAFDLVNQGLLFHKLDSRYDFHTSAMGMVSSFLRDRSMVVEVDGMESALRYLSSGVLVFVFQSSISMLMIFRFICSGIGRIWMR